MFRVCLLLTLACLLAKPGIAAEQRAVRVAVGPYFGPLGNPRLQSTADNIGDLLAAELAGNSRFHVVERAQVKAIVKELQLSADGLTSAETTLKLGKLLSADWLISGMVAPAQTRTQSWTKVIDIHSGIVLEIDSTSLNEDLPSSVIDMGKFVGKVGRNSAGPKPYVALGPFRDYSMKAGGRPDWSGELQELMEKAFRERGFGIVEREAIGMIAQEIHLDGTGLTAVGTNRVKLQPAFWLVDGGSQWLEESGTNLMLTLRLQKVGAKPTLLRITNTPGPVLMQTIRRELAGALGAGQNASAAAATAEGRVQADRGDELARARNPLADPEYLNSARGDVAEARRDNARKAIQHYEAAYALNPNDLQAKYMLGHALCADPETLERGKQLLWQIVKVNDAKL